jgi:hypothetical protein
MNSIKTLVVLILVTAGQPLLSQKAIFLHHSTGEGVYSQGNVSGWIETYNSEHGTSFQVSEMNYPNTPYPWENYPYDYWNLWINHTCDNSDPDIACMDNLCASYDVIIFKHCFPGADIAEDDLTSSVSSSKKTLENYKLQYRALRDLMDSYPDNEFIVWTLTPLHRLATDPQNAARARKFVDWVKEEWLKEDEKSHSNIHIFDFFNIIAEDNPSPAKGAVNCLKYDYEKSHSDNDSHPNTLANQTVGPLFAEFIVNTMQELPAGVSRIEINEPVISFDQSTLRVQMTTINQNRILSIYGIMGNTILNRTLPNYDFVMDINFLPKGLYIFVISENQKSWAYKIGKN